MATSATYQPPGERVPIPLVPKPSVTETYKPPSERVPTPLPPKPAISDTYKPPSARVPTPLPPKPEATPEPFRPPPAVTPVPITIVITKNELESIARAKETGQCVGAMKAYYTVKTYKVVVGEGKVIFVEALAKREAKRKAEAAGYKVAWLTKTTKPVEAEDVGDVSVSVELEASREYARLYGGIPKTGASEEEKKAYRDAVAWIMGEMKAGTYKPPTITIGVYKVTGADGKVLQVEARSEVDAISIAGAYGLRGATEAKKVDEKSITPIEAQQKIVDAKGIDAAWAVKTYGGALGEAYDVPEEMIPVLDGDGIIALMPRDAWDGLSDEYKAIIEKEGFDAYRDKFVVLPDGQWMEKTQLAELRVHDKQYGTNYEGVALERGFTALQSVCDSDRKVTDAAVTKLEGYKTETGFNVLLARAEGITSEELRLAGFPEDVVKWADESYQTSVATGVALPGEMTRVVMFEPETGSLLPMEDRKVITGKDYANLLSDWETKAKRKLSDKDWDTYLGLKESLGTTGMGNLKVLEGKAGVGMNPMRYAVLSGESAKRMNIEGAATLFFVPARAALPEVKLGDIRPLEWAIGGAQIAAWVMPFVPKGVMPFVSGAAGGIFGYSTAQNWDKLSTGMKALAVVGTALVSLPALFAIGKVISPVAVKVPGAKGTEITVWRGIQVNGKPIIGISQSKPTFGTWGIKRPTLAQIERGWHPVTKLETTLLGTRNSLKKMGVSEADIVKVEAVWETGVPTFVRKKPPTKVAPEEILSGSQRLTPEETAAVLRVSVKHGKQVDMIYGSSTMRPQLKEALRNWRQWHDIDIQTSMTNTQLVGFVDDIMRELRKLKVKVRVSPDNPGMIEKFANGEWVKITDIHTREILPGAVEAWETGGYGYRYTEMPIRVKVPGVGELRMMTLSEMGLRKGGAITRFQVTEIAPYSYRINDIADFYTIVLNYKGPALAERVAKAFGYTGEQLSGVAARNPQRWNLWAVSPSLTPARGSPSVAISIPIAYSSKLPSSLRASLETYSPAISTSPYMMRASPSLATIGSPSGSVSPSLMASPSVGPSTSPSVSAVPSSTTSVSPSLYASVSPSPSPSRSPYPSPSPSVSPTPRPSPEAYPMRSPTPYPSPYPAPHPSPYPYPVPAPHRLPVIEIVGGQPRHKIPSGSIAWKQGLFWKYIPPPWNQQKPITVKNPPIGARFIGEKTPDKTIQMIGKPGAKVPKSVTVDLGVVDIKIEDYGQRIGFSGRGLETVTGHSIPGATTGMSIPGRGVMKVRTVKSKRRPKRELRPSASAI